MSNFPPCKYLRAARVPATLLPQEFGKWTIVRRIVDTAEARELLGVAEQTLLCRWSLAGLHLPWGEIVMDDSMPELRRHLPIWLAARGRVLKTGLGLGCVVRGLLINPAVEHVDVVEIDEDIIRICGAEFVDNPRVTIHHADATEWEYGARTWDFAWHDVHDNFEREHLALTHVKLIHRYSDRVPLQKQGAWALPREAKRLLGNQVLGA